jgi:hypothetical protein
VHRGGGVGVEWTACHHSKAEASPAAPSQHMCFRHAKGGLEPQQGWLRAAACSAQGLSCGGGVSLCALDLHHASPCAQLGLCLPLMSRHPQQCLVCHSQPAATHHTTSRLGQCMVVPPAPWHACRVRGPMHDLAGSAQRLSTAPACLLMPAQLPLHPCATPPTMVWHESTGPHQPYMHPGPAR